MSTTQLSLARTARHVPLAVRSAQALVLLPLGALVGIACVAFTATAPPSSLGAGDWAVAVWALATAVANLILGIRLGRGSERARLALIAVAVAHVVFGIVKLTVYGESASFAFMALDAAVIALLTGSSVRCFCRRG